VCALKLNPAYTDINRRETLELRLFAAELLVDAALDNHDAAGAARDLKYPAPLPAVTSNTFFDGIEVTGVASPR
jgi:hypothetical protein